MLANCVAEGFRSLCGEGPSPGFSARPSRSPQTATREGVLAQTATREGVLAQTATREGVLAQTATREGVLRFAYDFLNDDGVNGNMFV